MPYAIEETVVGMSQHIADLGAFFAPEEACPEGQFEKMLLCSATSEDLGLHNVKRVNAMRFGQDRNGTRLFNAQKRYRYPYISRIGLILPTFYSRFAEIARPLHQLTLKDTIFAWSDSTEEAFRELLMRPHTPPITRFPDYEREFIV